VGERQRMGWAAIAAVACTIGAGAVAAQGAAPGAVPGAPEGAERTPPGDEVVVRGRRPAQLRLEIERAEDAFYARFNEVNGGDDFDITCRDELQTGSNIPRRVCRAQFEREALADVGKDFALGVQGSPFAVGSGEFVTRAYYMQGRLEAELSKRVAEDPKLLAALMKLVDLQQAYKDSQKKK
jgi:hypothetical protein